MEDNKLKGGSGSFSYGADDQLVAAWMENQSNKTVSIRFAIQDYAKRNGVSDVMSSSLSELNKIGEGVDYAEKVRIQNEKIADLNEIIEQQRLVIKQYGAFADRLNNTDACGISIVLPCDEELEDEEEFELDLDAMEMTPEDIAKYEEAIGGFEANAEIPESKKTESDPHNADDCIIEDFIDDTFSPIDHMTEDEVESLKVNDPEVFEEIADADLPEEEEHEQPEEDPLAFLNSPAYNEIRRKTAEVDAGSSKPRNVYINSVANEPEVSSSFESFEPNFEM